MIKALINCYACCPGMGSEQGMGWNWVTSLAAYCELHVITESEYRNQIEAALNDDVETDDNRNKYGLTKEQRANIHFYWNTIGGDDAKKTVHIRRMCWNQGDWRFYTYYKQWQLQTAKIAKQIIAEVNGIQILHQLNMIGFREPGYLWKVSQETGIPLVWGPIGGLKKFPLAYVKGDSLRMWSFNSPKNAITHWQIAHSHRVKTMLHQASILISSIPDSYRAIKKFHGLESVIIPETGCSISSIQTEDNPSRFHEKALNVMWVGKFDFRKRLDIAVSSIGLCSDRGAVVHLCVYGSGPQPVEAKIRKQIAKCGLDNNAPDRSSVRLMGCRSNDDIKKAMAKADVFLFTSVSEDTSTVVLEAVQSGLPVICFDACGMSSVIETYDQEQGNQGIGVKIPLSNPNQSAKEFAEVFVDLYEHREKLKAMSRNCQNRAVELSWDNKAQKVVHLYEQAINTAVPRTTFKSSGKLLRVAKKIKNKLKL